ncbi:RNA-guided endonuclease InsQ/TnpB family protein [Glycomyces sp. MUSA5-2]|uniref:RNA-guided endonuclease InsQ/TnpB family protein n=1 Tax=Glycomyces sp. MUSA5-2 TaxID=2053002 RepID=UPI00300AF144
MHAAVKKSFKFRLRPNRHQRRALEAMLRDHCELYNAALEERRLAWSKAGVSIQYGGQSAQLRDLRRADPEGQGRWSFSSQQATLRRLNRAFEGFFRRVRQGGAPGYPRFKSIRRFDSVTWPSNGDGCKWVDGDEARDSITRVRLHGVGAVRVHRHRQVEGRIKTITAKREGPAWFVVLTCEVPPGPEAPKSGEATGIDLGLIHFATTAQGEHFAPLRTMEVNGARLADAQRELARFRRPAKRSDRSAAHRRAALNVAKLHRKIANQRRDFAHKTARALVDRFDVIAVEHLNIAGLTRRPKPVQDPERGGGFLPNGRSAKSSLNRRIQDAAWGQFVEILTAKAAWAGREVIKVNPAYTSQTCPSCGHVDAASRERERFCCTACGHADHADRVGAVNIATRAGLVLGERGRPRAPEAQRRVPQSGVTEPQEAPRPEILGASDRPGSCSSGRDPSRGLRGTTGSEPFRRMEERAHGQ